MQNASRRALPLVIALGVIFAGSVGEAHDRTCGGTAPFETSCSTGTHTTLPVRLDHGVVPGVGYSGWLESKIVHPGGARTYRCLYTAGVSMMCEGSGPYPLPGEIFTHRCRSDFADGQPGGVNGWTCFVKDPPASSSGGSSDSPARSDGDRGTVRGVDLSVGLTGFEPATS